MVKTILLVALGGAIGSVLRYLTSVFVAKYYSNVFPLATFITNAVGCVLIGIFIGLIVKNEMASQDIKWFLITGFCGGYTTFSAFSYENITLFQNGNSALALAYIGLSVIIGLSAVWLGLYLTR